MVTLLQVVRLEVFVAVLDINDNAPKFSFEIKTFNVSEVSPVGTSAVLSMERQGDTGCLQGDTGCLRDHIGKIYIQKPQHGWTNLLFSIPRTPK